MNTRGANVWLRKEVREGDADLRGAGTGATGVLERRVWDLLRARGYRVRVLSRSGTYGTIRGDLTIGESSEGAVAGV